MADLETVNVNDLPTGAALAKVLGVEADGTTAGRALADFAGEMATPVVDAIDASSTAEQALATALAGNATAMASIGGAGLFTIGSSQRLLSAKAADWLHAADWGGTATVQATLKARAGARSGQQMLLAGYTSVGDGGGGLFVWDAASTATDDGGTIINPTDNTTGRWYRIYNGGVRVAWFGLDETGTSDTRASLNSILATHKHVIFSRDASYKISSHLSVGAGAVLEGNRASLIAVAVAGPTAMMIITGDKISVSGLRFNGEAEYPSDTTLGRATVEATGYHHAITLDGASNVTIEDNIFYKITGSSVYGFNSASAVKVINNTFTDACYVSPCVYFNVASDVKIIGNQFTGGGPTAWVDPTVHDPSGDCEAIQLYVVDDFDVSNNTLTTTPANGILVEFASRGSVSNNNITNPSYEGIVAYNSCYLVAIENNTITNWGRIPIPRQLFTYNSKLYIPREYPHSSNNPFPSDPSASSVWQEWPYVTGSLNTGLVPDYSTKSYWNGSTGVLANRGLAAINVCQNSYRCTVSGNTVKADRTLVNGKYQRASDLGFTWVVHSNAPFATGVDSIATVAGNAFDGVITDFNRNLYQDPISLQGLRTSAITHNGNFYRDLGPDIFQGGGSLTHTVDMVGGGTAVWTATTRRMQVTVTAGGGAYAHWKFTPGTAMRPGARYLVSGMLRKITGSDIQSDNFRMGGAGPRFSYNTTTHHFSAEVTCNDTSFIEVIYFSDVVSDYYLDRIEMRQILATTDGAREDSVAVQDMFPVADATAALPATPNGTSLGLAVSAESVLTGSTTNNSSATETASFVVVVDSAMLKNTAMTIVARAKVSAARQVAATIDATAKVVSDGSLGSDLVTTSAQALTTSYADYYFTMPMTSIIAGSKIVVTLSCAADDTGGSTNGAITVSAVTVQSHR